MLPTVITLILTAIVFVGLWQILPIGTRLGDSPDDSRSRVSFQRFHRPHGGPPTATLTVDNPGPASVQVGADARRAWRLGVFEEPLSVRVPRPSRRPSPVAATPLGTVSGNSSRTWHVPLGPEVTTWPAVKVAVTVEHIDGRRRILTHRIARQDLIGVINLDASG